MAGLLSRCIGPRALPAGLKALVGTVPRSRLGLVNGLFIMAGGLGATMATRPIAALTDALGWRGAFAALAVITLLATLWIACLPPERAPAGPRRGLGLAGLRVVFRSARFWRFAPLSCCVVGTAFAEHGLWAARWMAQVDRLPAPVLMDDMLAMGLGLTAGAAVLGALASALRARGIPTPLVFLGACLAFLGVQALLVCRVTLPGWVPGWMPWSVLARFGGMTALSYSVTGESFPEEAIGRVNAALNVLHIGMAFVLQAGMGMQWPCGGRMRLAIRLCRHSASRLPCRCFCRQARWCGSSRPSDVGPASASAACGAFQSAANGRAPPRGVGGR